MRVHIHATFYKDAYVCVCVHVWNREQKAMTKEGKIQLVEKYRLYSEYYDNGRLDKWYWS